MGRPDLGRPAAPLVPHHLQIDDDAIDEGLQHGLPVEPKVEAKPVELELVDLLGFRWRVPLSWVNNPFGVLTLYRDQLDVQTHDQVIVY